MKKAVITLSDPRFGRSDCEIRTCPEDMKSIALELIAYAAARQMMPAEVHMSIEYPEREVPFYNRSSMYETR